MPVPQRVTVYGMMITPFTDEGALDEAALRAHLRRMVATGTPVVMTSPANGEGYALTIAEHRRVYEIAVEECRGKVPVWANTRAGRTAADVYEVAREAVAAGVDVVNLYQCQAGGNVALAEREQEAYWVELLETLRAPVNISLNPQMSGGYVAPLALMNRLVRRFEQVVGICCYVRGSGGSPGAAFLEWRRALPAHLPIVSNVDNFVRGAAGSIESGSNVIPATLQAIADGWNAGDLTGFTTAFQQWERFKKVAYDGWAQETNTARWSKTALRAVGLGNGVLRPPSLAPTDQERETVAQALDRLEVPEWSALRARVAVA